MKLLCAPALLLFTMAAGLPDRAIAQTGSTKAAAPVKPAGSPIQPAASQGTAPDPKKLPYIEEIFRLTKPEGMVSGMLSQYKGAFQQAAGQGYEQEVRKFDDPAKYRADFNKLQDRVFALLTSRLDWQKLKPQFVQVYSDTFTVEELSGMAAFYRSPGGHAFLEKMPSVLQKWSQVSQQQVGNVGPEIQKMMSDFMADIKKRSAANAPKAPAKQ